MNRPLNFDENLFKETFSFSRMENVLTGLIFMK